MKIESMNIERILDSIKDLKQYEYQVVICYNECHYITNWMRSSGKDEPQALEALKQKLSNKIYKVESIRLI